MPIIVPKDIPASKILQEENIVPQEEINEEGDSL